MGVTWHGWASARRRVAPLPSGTPRNSASPAPEAACLQQHEVRCLAVLLPRLQLHQGRDRQGLQQVQQHCKAGQGGGTKGWWRGGSCMPSARSWCGTHREARRRRGARFPWLTLRRVARHALGQLPPSRRLCVLCQWAVPLKVRPEGRAARSGDWERRRQVSCAQARELHRAGQASRAPSCIAGPSAPGTPTCSLETPRCPHLTTPCTSACMYCSMCVAAMRHSSASSSAAAASPPSALQRGEAQAWHAAGALA